MNQPTNSYHPFHDSPQQKRPKYFRQAYIEAKNLVVREKADRAYKVARSSFTEKTAYSIWTGRQLKPHGLTTTGGKNISIIAPGWRNRGPGPDFNRAEIIIEGSGKVTGDVEIDPRPGDWETHGHSSDPAYNNVILHIVITGSKQGTEPRKQNGELVPEFVLTEHLIKPLTELAAEEKSGSPAHHQEPGACEAVLQSWPREKIGNLMDLAGDERVIDKSRRLEGETVLSGYSQITYQRIMEALGYTPNRRPFGDLSNLLTEDLLYSSIATMTDGEGESVLEALFFGVSSLFPEQVPLKDDDKETEEYLSALLSAWKIIGEEMDVAAMDRREWKLKGLRPANNPRRRIAGMARLMIRHREHGLFGTLLKELNCDWGVEGASGMARRISHILTVAGEGYWSRRSNFGPSNLQRSFGLIGKERVEIILVNAVIPALLAYSVDENHGEVEANLHSLYAVLPASMPNRTLRFIIARMFGGETLPPHIKLNARRQQGLIQIYHDFCEVNQGGCGDCLFPLLLEHL